MTFKVFSIRLSTKTDTELEKLCQIFSETKAQVIRRIIEDRFLKEGFRHERTKVLDGRDRS